MIETPITLEDIAAWWARTGGLPAARVSDTIYTLNHHECGSVPGGDAEEHGEKLKAES